MPKEMLQPRIIHPISRNLSTCCSLINPLRHSNHLTQKTASLKKTCFSFISVITCKHCPCKSPTIFFKVFVSHMCYDNYKWQPWLLLGVTSLQVYENIPENQILEVVYINMILQKHIDRNSLNKGSHLVYEKAIGSGKIRYININF